MDRLAWLTYVAQLEYKVYLRCSMAMRALTVKDCPELGPGGPGGPGGPWTPMLRLEPEPGNTQHS